MGSDTNDPFSNLARMSLETAASAMQALQAATTLSTVSLKPPTFKMSL